MSLLDLSQVTRVLINLIDTHVNASSVWSGSSISVVPDPPDTLEGDSTIGLYLYHIKEDASLSNACPAGNSQPPICYTPLPLILYYQLSTHSGLSSPTGTYREQLLLGAAVKALRCHTIINDDTVVDGMELFPDVLRGDDNRIQIELRPVSADEAVSFWTAGSSPLRLACYYQVSIILLKPEEFNSSAGPVLNYNIYAFPQQNPFITSIVNQLLFTVPGESTSRAIQLRPAQVAISSEFQINGTSFKADDTHLLISHADWDEPIEVNSVDWALQVTNEKVTAQVQETIGTEDVVPGVYSAFVRVMKRRTSSDGIEREFLSLSNAAPFVVAPRIDTIGAPNGLGEFSVTGRLFQHALIAADSVLVFVGDHRLLARTARTDSTLNPGEFFIVSPDRIDVRLPSDLTSGQQVYFRLQIRQANSAPKWVEVP